MHPSPFTVAIIALYFGINASGRRPCEPTKKCYEISEDKLNLTLNDFKKNKINCIDVHDCNISFIQENLFSNFENLKNLYLRNLPLEYEAIKNSLPKSGTRLNHLCLENVGLNNSQLVDILPYLPRTISALGLKNNAITFFSTEFISNTTLEKLDLSYNRNVTLMLNKTAPTLTEFYLSYSDVKWRTSSEITNTSLLPSLLALYLEGNYINLSVIDNEQNGFGKLKDLNLSNCNLAEPLNKKSFSFMPNLLTLSLSNVSSVEHLPNFQNIKNLRTLNLDDIKYPFYPSSENMNLFVNLQRLQRLRMRNWNLQWWNETELYTLFRPIKDTVETLYLVSTGLTTIPQVTAEMIKLKKLLLSNNSISTWNSISERTNKNLVVLSLRWNLIETVNPYFIPQRVRELDLEGNPFLCTCELMSYKTWVWKNKLVAIVKDWQTKYHCSKPEEWTGRSLDAFRPKKSDCQPFNRYVITAIILCCCMVVIVAGTHIVTYKRAQHAQKKQKRGFKESRPLLSA